MFELGFERVAAAEVAGHVAADFDFGFWGRSQMKVRVEAGGGVDLADGDVELFREQVELVGGEVSELVLDGAKFVEQAKCSASMISGDWCVESYRARYVSTIGIVAGYRVAY